MTFSRLEVIGSDAEKHEVGARTKAQMFAYLERYCKTPWKRYRYIKGTQEVIDQNIYATFYDNVLDVKTRLRVADYADLAREIR